MTGFCCSERKQSTYGPPHETVKYLESLRQQHKLLNLEALDKWMIREGIEREELVDSLNRQSLRNQVFRREVYWKVEKSISDDEIHQYYELHKESFAKEEGGFQTLADVRNEVNDRIFQTKAQQAVQEYFIHSAPTSYDRSQTRLR
jgi:hypothetical protein